MPLLWLVGLLEERCRRRRRRRWCGRQAIDGRFIHERLVDELFGLSRICTCLLLVVDGWILFHTADQDAQRVRRLLDGLARVGLLRYCYEGLVRPCSLLRRTDERHWRGLARRVERVRSRYRRGYRH